VVLPGVRGKAHGLCDGQAVHSMLDKKLQAEQVATSAAGHGELRSGRVSGKRLRDYSDQPRQIFVTDSPGFKLHTIGRSTYGGRAPETPPCGKCGCEFVNVGCPKIWPIGTVVLTCSKCGSVVDYIDGLLIMSVTEAIQSMRGREWVIRYRMALELSESRGIHRDLVMAALEQGMTMDEIVTALDMEMPNA